MNRPQDWSLEDVFSVEAMRSLPRRLIGKKDILFGLCLTLGCLALVCLLLAVLSAAYA